MSESIAYRSSDGVSGVPVSAANPLPVTLEAGGAPATGVQATTNTQAINEAASSYAHLAAAATTQVKSGAGVLRRVAVNTKGTVASTISIYDATSGTTNPIAIIDSLNLSGSFSYGLAFTTGLRVIITGTVAPDVTVVYD